MLHTRQTTSLCRQTDRKEHKLSKEDLFYFPNAIPNGLIHINNKQLTS